MNRADSLAAGVLGGLVARHLTKRALAFGGHRSLSSISRGEASMAYHLLQPETLYGLLQSVDPRILSILAPKDIKRIVEQARDSTCLERGAVAGEETIETAVQYLLQHGGAVLIGDSSLDAICKRLEPIAPKGLKRSDQNAPAAYYPSSPPAALGALPSFTGIESMLVMFPSHYPRRWNGHLALIRALTAGVRVTIAVRNEPWERLVALMLQTASVDLGRVEFVRLSYDDMWARDAGPEFVDTINGPVVLCHAYVPNGLGYHPRDSEYSIELGRQMNTPVHRIPLVMDGAHLKPAGSRSLFVSNGLVNHNPDLTQAQVTDILREWFGVDSLISIPTLPRETTGHVDLSILPVDQETVIVGRVNPRHGLHRSLETLATQLEQTSTGYGSRYRVLRLDGPNNTPRFHEWSYVNSVIANDVVVMPSYGPDDDQARQTLERAFPNRQVIPVDCSDLPVGAVHCLTKELWFRS